MSSIINTRPLDFKPIQGEAWVLDLVNVEMKKGNVAYIASKMHMIEQAEENGYASTIGEELSRKYHYNYRDYHGPFEHLKIVNIINEEFGEKFNNMTLYKREDDEPNNA